jgi:hypothetical protein
VSDVRFWDGKADIAEPMGIPDCEYTPQVERLTNPLVAGDCESALLVSRFARTTDKEPSQEKLGGGAGGEGAGEVGKRKSPHPGSVRATGMR